MDKSDDGNYVETVLGSTKMAELGVILPHEYLICDFSTFYRPSLICREPYDITSCSLRNFGYVRQYPYSHLYNLQLNDKDGINAIFKEVELFKEADGGTIVDKSSCLNRDIDLLKTISNLTKVNIIIGTGYHITDAKNLATCTTTIEEMYNQIHNDFENGCRNHPSVKPAFIADGGNICLEFEKRAFRAIGEYQGQNRYPVSFHPGQDVIPLTEVIRIYQEAGGRATEFVMSHIDRTLTTTEDLMEFIDGSKCYLQFDQFGVESSFYQLNSRVDVMSDAQTINFMLFLKDNGLLYRVLMSHDIHTKHRLMTFGGLGYTHISKNVEPMMLERGFTIDDIHVIRNKNPYRWLNQLNL